MCRGHTHRASGGRAGPSARRALTRLTARPHDASVTFLDSCL